MKYSNAIKDITEFIFVNDQPKKSDVILVPGSSKSQITECAAELYNSGYAPFVLPSGRYSSSLGHFANENVDNICYQGNYKTDFEYCKNILMLNGVPENAIICEDQATNTMENAMYSLKVLQSHGIIVNRALICCQAFHARRAYMSYACYFKGVELLVIPTNTQGISRNNWYKSDFGICKVMKEVEKCGKYFVDYIDDIAQYVDCEND